MTRTPSNIARLTALASAAAVIASSVGAFMSDARLKQNVSPLRSA